MGLFEGLFKNPKWVYRGTTWLTESLPNFNLMNTSMFLKTKTQKKRFRFKEGAN